MRSVFDKRNFNSDRLSGNMVSSNERIIYLYPAPNIHHLFIKFDPKFLLFFGEALYALDYYCNSS